MSSSRFAIQGDRDMANVLSKPSKLLEDEERRNARHVTRSWSIAPPCPRRLTRGGQEVYLRGPLRDQYVQEFSLTDILRTSNGREKHSTGRDDLMFRMHRIAANSRRGGDSEADCSVAKFLVRPTGGRPAPVPLLMHKTVMDLFFSHQFPRFKHRGFVGEIKESRMSKWKGAQTN